MLFQNRVDAGRRLGEALRKYAGNDVVVVGLPRGGVPVAAEVARAIGAPLDVIVVRKLGVPYQPELGMGAIGEAGVRVINQSVLRQSGVSEADLAEVERRERAELERRADKFRGNRPRESLAGRTVIVVDDGIATGSTARAACQVARAAGATRVVLATPVAPPDVVGSFDDVADEVVCLSTPEPFFAIGQFYADFGQTSDAEVVELLQRPAPATAHVAPDPTQPRRRDKDKEVQVRAGRVHLPGHLTIPAGASGIVIFAHGSGSSRHSPRNQFVASALNEAGVGTLLFDLLTMEEERDRGNVFDIDLLADRLVQVTAWLRGQPEAEHTRIGYFGASTGAAAALVAAAAPGNDIATVVSRGGRVDLASTWLSEVRAPTLLIVGGADKGVLDLNRAAQARLRCENRLEVVPGATHLFEEPGALETVARLASEWFSHYLAPAPQVAG